MRKLLLSSASVALLSLGALALAPATAQQTEPSNQPTTEQPSTQGQSYESVPEVTTPAAPDATTEEETTETLQPVPANPVEEAEEAADAAAEAEEQPTGQLQAEAIQPPETIMVEEVLDADVLDVTGEDVAWVEEVLVSPEGSLTHVVIGHGGFLGIGSKSILIPWDTVAYDASEETLRIQGNEADLEAAPEFVTREDYEDEQAAEREQLGAVPRDEDSSGVPQQTE